MDFEFDSDSVAQTIELGRKIGSQLKGAEIIGLIGPLGSGKTYLIKGIVAGADAKDISAVTSPTFVLVNEYTGRLDIYHIDAYRMRSAREFEMVGFDDFCCETSVVLIEWADKVESILQLIDYIRVELSHVGKSKRKISIKNLPEYIRC